MRNTRIYQNYNLNLDQPFLIDEKKSHHILHVLRMKMQAELILFNGQGGEYRSYISNIIKKRIEVTPVEFLNINNESPLQIHLGQAISRGEKMDFTLQKAVELGITQITPLITMRSQKIDEQRLSKKMEHWQSIVISACEQSGRSIIPALNEPQHLSTWCTRLDNNTKLLLNPHHGQNLKDIAPLNNCLAILIGSEGGLDEQEITFALNHQFHSIQLGPRTLRTETAALATISAVQTLWGDFSIFR